MLRAMRAISQGCDLTSAATQAGFASTSDFSDAFRRMSGLTATTLITMGLTIIVDRAEPADHCPVKEVGIPMPIEPQCIPTAPEHTMAQAVGL